VIVFLVKQERIHQIRLWEDSWRCRGPSCVVISASLVRFRQSDGGDQVPNYTPGSAGGYLPRRFPAPWRADKMPGVRDANGQALLRRKLSPSMTRAAERFNCM
jgi:hypothetical protein